MHAVPLIVCFITSFYLIDIKIKKNKRSVATTPASQHPAKKTKKQKTKKQKTKTKERKKKKKEKKGGGGGGGLGGGGGGEEGTPSSSSYCLFPFLQMSNNSCSGDVSYFKSAHSIAFSNVRTAAAAATTTTEE